MYTNVRAHPAARRTRRRSDRRVRCRHARPRPPSPRLAPDRKRERRKRCAEVQVFAATSSVSSAEPRRFGPFAGSSAPQAAVPQLASRATSTTAAPAVPDATEQSAAAEAPTAWHRAFTESIAKRSSSVPSSLQVAREGTEAPRREERRRHAQERVGDLGVGGRRHTFGPAARPAAKMIGVEKTVHTTNATDVFATRASSWRRYSFV